MQLIDWLKGKQFFLSTIVVSGFPFKSPFHFGLESHCAQYPIWSRRVFKSQGPPIIESLSWYRTQYDPVTMVGFNHPLAISGFAASHFHFTRGSKHDRRRPLVLLIFNMFKQNIAFCLLDSSFWGTGKGCKHFETTFTQCKNVETYCPTHAPSSRQQFYALGLESKGRGCCVLCITSATKATGFARQILANNCPCGKMSWRLGRFTFNSRAILLCVSQAGSTPCEVKRRHSSPTKEEHISVMSSPSRTNSSCKSKSLPCVTSVM